MAETYCGKTCSSCSRKKDLNCGGCRVGPGRPYATECPIAKCALSRKRRECEGCVNASTCYTRKGADQMAENRYRKEARQKADRYLRLEISQVLSKWLLVLFFFEIVWVVLNVTMSLMNGQSEGVSFGGFLIAPMLLLHGLIFFRISCGSDRFNLAGIFTLIYAGTEFFQATLAVAEEVSWLTAMVFLASLVFSLLAVYQEFCGFAEATEPLDENLANKWSGLWLVNFCCLVAAGVSVPIMYFNLLVGMLVLLLGTVGSIAVTVIKLVYLRETVKLFRQYVENTAKFI